MPSLCNHTYLVRKNQVCGCSKSDQWKCATVAWFEEYNENLEGFTSGKEYWIQISSRTQTEILQCYLRWTFSRRKGCLSGGKKERSSVKHSSARAHRGIKLEYSRQKTVWEFNFSLRNKAKLNLEILRVTWIFIFTVARIYRRANSQNDEAGVLTRSILLKNVTCKAKMLEGRWTWQTKNMRNLCFRLRSSLNN